MIHNEQYEALANDQPHLKVFAEVTFPARFQNATKQTTCDGEQCGKKLRINQINIFVTPAPEYKPMVVCLQCLKLLYQQNVVAGSYGNGPLFN